MAHAIVIGGGVIGLSTALALQEAGWTTHVVAAATGAGTTSAAAGACWYPFCVGPPARAARWATVTHRWLTALAERDASAGVDVLVRHELALGNARPWWADELHAPDLRRATLPATAGEHAGMACWTFPAPRCDTRLFLPWLESRLDRPVIRRRVTSFEEARPLAGCVAGLVVNCAGLGARALTGDRELQAVFGQTVIAAIDGFDPGACIGDERDMSRIYYSIPRRGEVVLGGCAEACPDDRPAEPSSDMTERLVARARRFGVTPRVLRASAGLRPARPAVRLEVDPVRPWLIHNYGHGGAGYTLARGCAEEVAAMAQDARARAFG